MKAERSGYGQPLHPARWPIVGVTWVVVGLIVTAPLWITHIEFLGRLWLGPALLLLYKPGDAMAGKVFIAMLLAVPAALCLAVLARRWRRIANPVRLLWLATGSVLWHAPALAWWVLLANSMN